MHRVHLRRYFFTLNGIISFENDLIECIQRGCQFLVFLFVSLRFRKHQYEFLTFISMQANKKLWKMIEIKSHFGKKKLRIFVKNVCSRCVCMWRVCGTFVMFIIQINIHALLPQVKVSCVVSCFSAYFFLYFNCRLLHTDIQRMYGIVFEFDCCRNVCVTLWTI